MVLRLTIFFGLHFQNFAIFTAKKAILFFVNHWTENDFGSQMLWTFRLSFFLNFQNICKNDKDTLFREFVYRR